MKPRVTLGWTELVEFPEWHIRALRAKIDTGARSSALHVENVTRLVGNRIRFDVVTDHKRHPVTARPSRKSTVKSSNGTRTTRYFIETTIILGGVKKEIEISLVDRGEMGFRMLVGRTALSGDFVVDPARRMFASKTGKKKTKAAKRAKLHAN